MNAKGAPSSSCAAGSARRPNRPTSRSPHLAGIIGTPDVLRRNPRGKVTAARSAEERTAKPPDEGETKGREVETAQRYYLDATYNRETTARAPRWKNSGEAGINHDAQHPDRQAP